ERLRQLGIKYIYLNLQFQEPLFRERWLAAMGLQGEPTPLSDEERKGMWSDPRTKWKVLLAGAIAERRVVPAKGFRRGILFEIPD
ncbi:MAG TPA: hypothetical protein VEX38_05270, partial [Fimbriimonadaceae bacterium]|nr:hypothetical protein [Fimbriimonadaceae bacterium]